VSHPDPDVLALAALDEAVDEATNSHLAECPRCRAELAEMQRVVHGARHGDQPLDLTAPPTQVWDRIAAEVGIAGAPSADVAARAGARAEVAARPEAGAEMAARRDGRRRRWAPILAAAAGVVVGATAGGLAVSQFGGDDDGKTPATTTVASASLQPLTPAATAGQAAIVRQDGARVLTLRLPTAAGDQASAFREVWLLDTEAGRLVSLGVLEGSRGRFTLPRDLDLADYPTVDVSAEPFDGDPGHSGDSLVRGDLTF
jgi:anti-sigma-K factor RskA